MTLFDIIENILFLKSEDVLSDHIDNPDFNSIFSNFMILRYCTMTNNESINRFIALNLVNLENLDSKLLYKYLIKILPKQRKHFIKYIK